MASHMDPQLVDKIVHEVKSQGVFDEFRKGSMSDVDTKPAYQNLRQRVESTVKKFLSEQSWYPEMNKNQLRERLRKHITESGFLDVGVERIVDQVVNPKIGSVFQPKIEEIAYKYLGLPVPMKFEPPAPLMAPIMPPLPPLPMNGTPLKIETNSSLLPTGLEQISPDSDKATDKSDCKDLDQGPLDMDIDDHEDESPPFESLMNRTDMALKEEILIKKEPKEENNFKKSDVKPIKTEEIFDENKPHDQNLSVQTFSEGQAQNTSTSELAKAIGALIYDDVVASQESQLSEVSSDSHISDVTANASHSFTESSNAPQITQTANYQLEDAAVQNGPVNISEEAQMPKFNENSSDTNTMEKTLVSQFHFDINKDEIKFEGTERKSGIMVKDGDCASVAEGDNSSGKSVATNGDLKKKNVPCQFGSIDAKVDDPPVVTPITATPTPTPHENSFGSSLEDASSHIFIGKAQQEAAAVTVDSINATTTTLQSEKKENGNVVAHSSSSSSSRHKKHSKHKHESKEKSKEKDKERDKDKEKDRNREKEKKKEKDKDKDNDRKSKDKSRDGVKDKDRGRDRHRDKSRDKHSKGKSSTGERSNSGSKRSSSCISRSEWRDTKRDKHEDEKRHKHSKKSNRKSETVTDDHESIKVKVQRNKSTDSNDEDKKGGTGSSVSGGHNSNNINTQIGTVQPNKNATTNTDNIKSKTKNEDEKKDSEKSIAITPTEVDINDNQFLPKHQLNKVVLLDDMLQDPNTMFIEFGATVKSHTNSMPTKRDSIDHMDSDRNTSRESNKSDLYFFEENGEQFSERLRTLDEAINNFRSVINFMKFHCADTDTAVDCDTQQVAKHYSQLPQNTTQATLTIDCIPAYGNDQNENERQAMVTNEMYGGYGMHRKRAKHSLHERYLPDKPSPTLSDASVNSKENMSVDKNSVEQSAERRLMALNKSNQQRYNSEDLYKPRPVLSQRSRRRGLDSVN